jgi:hypothetical protein
VERTIAREHPLPSDIVRALRRARLWSPVASAIPMGSGDISSALTLFAESYDIAIAREEILRRLCILTYCDEDEAVAIDNDYGLASYAFSSEPPRAWAT